MIPVFHLRGYQGVDPLDDLSPRSRTIVSMVMTTVISIVFLQIVMNVAHIAHLKYTWLLWAECVVAGLVFSPLFTGMRKSSSVVLLGIPVVMILPIDIFIHAQYGDSAWWFYEENGLLGGIPLFFQSIIVWGGDGFVIGPIALWCARVVARMLRTRPGNDSPQTPFGELFRKEYTLEEVDKPTRDLAFYILWVTGLLYAVYLALAVLGTLGASAFPGILRDILEITYKNPPLAINTFVKLTLMAVLASTAAYNTSLRYHTCIALITGHIASTAFSLFFFFHDAPPDPNRGLLLTSAIFDGILTLLFAWVMYHHRANRALYPYIKEFPEYYSIPHRLTRLFLRIFSFVTASIVAGVFLIRLFADGASGWGAVYGFPDPQLCNTLTKYSTISILCYLMLKNEELYLRLHAIVFSGYCVSVISSAIWLLCGMFSPIDVATRSGGSTTLDWYFMLNVAMDGGVVLLMFVIRRMYFSVEYSISALSPLSAQNTWALHDSFFEAREEQSGAVLRSIDRHVAGIRGRKRGLLNFPFALLQYVPVFLGGLRPIFSSMSREERLFFLRTYVLRPPDERSLSVIPGVANVLYQIGSASHALVAFAHYTDIKGQEAINFVPADARDRLQGDYPAYPPPFKHPAPLPDGPGDARNFKPDKPSLPSPLITPRVVTRISEPDIPDEVDYLIVGTGAGGAVMAYQLARDPGADPSRILAVERGPRYSPLQDFSYDEMEMVRKLYKEGGLQQSKRFDLMVLQGECVGGSTVINNAICFRMPDPVRLRWESEYALDLSGLDDAYDRIQEELGIENVPEISINQEVKKRFWKGVSAYNKSLTDDNEKLQKHSLQANFRNTVGDGLDNIGSKGMRKSSMLETYIPWAEGRGVRVISETSAVRFFAQHRRAEAVLLRTNLGFMKKVRVKKAVIIAGGVIASSHFLMRSGLRTNVGKGLSCNFAFPAALDFDGDLNAFDGTQITLGAIDTRSRAVFETYFNPPGAFSISLPFYFNRLNRTMKRYKHLVNFGALVGSEPNGAVELKPDILNGRAFTWELGAQDKEHIKYALSTLVELGRFAGANSIVLPTEPGVELPLTGAKTVASFRKSLASYPVETKDLHLATAHPQGGNRMLGDGSKYFHERVVNSRFQVDGFDNLYVADASIFPSGITVNPQWTIMALAAIASEHVLNQS